MIEIIVGLTLFGSFIAVSWLPRWWLAGWIDPDRTHSLFRLPVSIGLALVGFITIVNLSGRLLENSVHALVLYLVTNLAICVYLLWKQRKQLAFTHLWVKRKSLLTVALFATVLALPQWFQAVSGNRWDEAASSAIHLTAPN